MRGKRLQGSGLLQMQQAGAGEGRRGMDDPAGLDRAGNTVCGFHMRFLLWRFCRNRHTFFFIKGGPVPDDLFHSPALQPFRILLFFDLVQRLTAR